MNIPKYIENNILLKNSKKKIKFIIQNEIDKNNFVIIQNSNPINTKKKMLFLSKCLGNLVSQNIKGDKILQIKARKDLTKFNNSQKKKLLRYHQTNLGGSIHSDGPQLNSPPKYVAMACLNQAQKGGGSVLIDTRLIFNHLKKKNKKVFNILTKKFPFEKRGFLSKNGKKNILFKPIFEKKKNSINFRYLREYIEAGFQFSNKKYSSEIKNSFNTLDKLLEKKSFATIFKLKQGDILILNNKYMAHGRTRFYLNKMASDSRILVRSWIN
jgi:alpha-ketoglutarate-dependent taurine dioxygenase